MKPTLGKICVNSGLFFAYYVYHYLNKARLTLTGPLNGASAQIFLRIGRLQASLPNLQTLKSANISYSRNGLSESNK